MGLHAHTGIQLLLSYANEGGAQVNPILEVRYCLLGSVQERSNDIPCIQSHVIGASC